VVAVAVSARESILASLRSSDGPPVEVLPAQALRRSAPADPERLVAEFARRMSEHHAEVRRIDEAGIATNLASILAGVAVAPAGLPEHWLPHGPLRLDDSSASPLSLDELQAAGGAVTGCRLGISSTGTVVLDGGLISGRRLLSLWPDLHVCVLRSRDIVATVPDAIAALDPQTGPLTFVSGPSATSDIEFSRVEGVHGPRQLVVLVVS
jgi:L-lactate dehydrogenase complex protein LldG